jgi:hypothetical protein
MEQPNSQMNPPTFKKFFLSTTEEHFTVNRKFHLKIRGSACHHRILREDGDIASRILHSTSAAPMEQTRHSTSYCRSNCRLYGLVPAIYQTGGACSVWLYAGMHYSLLKIMWMH